MKRLLIITVMCAVGFLSAISFAEDSVYEPVPVMEHPSDNKWSKVKEELGKMLYFDPRLSGSNWISCATCHNPGLGWGDGLPRTIGDGQKELGRHAPTIINSGFFEVQMWDGRKKSLEDQAQGPIAATVEMNQDYDELIMELKALPGYVNRFEKVFGKNSLTIGNIAKAIATFERSVVSKNAPYDKYWAGDKSAMSSSAVNGMNVFFGKAKCSICHNGPVFTDSGFHNIGVKPAGPLKIDLGRYNETKDDFDKGAFKTPGLRDITQSSPYMHNGVESTLEDVISFYNRGGDVKENLSPFITPLGLSKQEEKDLVEFLKALDGEPILVTFPILP
ncbi:MAG: cytochrome-c peroxidase [Nitrospina sp.]|jgi:cytochrome c peroxidase|nr:cytochrome-c peroxidase [Nitrospina sp.]MBT3876258.1 cytochrome-c peroxidase [Nitrospina sp.]MBT4047977.1 cytochrome-c peroxidase [Nitrospina sp.]MBT4555936.1 cytochrome-c peroxidase [Nitrospina sp.]MBT5348007.1 cytochrome-c peroxidase [Nitrospina sp.]